MMQLKNTRETYGVIHLMIHWVSAILIAILFPLGLIMVGLDYYSAGYQQYPPVHKSLGVILLLITLLRLVWIVMSPIPEALPQQKIFAVLAKLAHIAIYLLIAVICISGYIIATADGRGIDVFSWFTLPALGEVSSEQTDRAGSVHFYAAWGLVGIIGLHVIGALKHHIIDKDRTLLRIFGK